jgi:hypothetical protein
LHAMPVPVPEETVMITALDVLVAKVVDPA